MKTRNKSHRGRLADYSSPRRGAGGTGRGTTATGTYDDIRLSPEAMWVHIPEVLYAQEVYDSAEGAVVESETPWFQYTSHYVASTKRSFACSAGAHRTQKCWGCAVLQHHMDNDGEFKNSPVGRSTRFAFPMIIAEKVFEAPAYKNGSVIKSAKTKKVITNWVPEGQLPAEIPNTNGLPSKIGLKGHFSISSLHLEQLIALEGKLGDHCRACATQLSADKFLCTGCQIGDQPIGKTITGSELSAFRTSRKPECAHCGTRNTAATKDEPGECFLEPQVFCGACGLDDQPQGMLHDFDLLLRRNSTSDKNWDIDCLAVRIAGASDELKCDEYREAVSNPYDLAKIFAGEALKLQEFKIPEGKRLGLSADYGCFESTDDEDASGSTGGPAKSVSY